MVWPFGKKQQEEEQPSRQDFATALKLVASRVMLGKPDFVVWRDLPVGVTEESLVAWVRGGNGRDVLSLARWRGLAAAELGGLSEVAGDVVRELGGEVGGPEDQGQSSPKPEKPAQNDAITISREPGSTLEQIMQAVLEQNPELREQIDQNPELLQQLKQAIQQQLQGKTSTGGSSYNPDASHIKPEAKELLKQGVYRYQAGDLMGAIDFWSQAIEIDPNLAPAYCNRGIAYFYLKQYEEAIADYTRAIDIDPNDAYTYNNRGVAYDHLKRYEEAIADYTRAIDSDPNNAYTYNNRGNAYKNLKHYEEAIADYTRAIDIDPNDAYTYNGRGSAYKNLKHYEEAIADYTRAIDIDPNDADAYNGRGNAYSTLERYEEAIRDCSQAVHLQPDYWEAWANRGIPLFNYSGYQAALENYKTGLSHLDPHQEPLGCAVLHRLTGRAHAQQGRNHTQYVLYWEARQCYKEAYDLIEANPLHTPDTLKILRDWIKADRAIGNHETANELTLNAIQRLTQALINADPGYRKILRVEFNDFYTLNVDRLISQNQPWQALIEAETWKRLALTWLQNPNADPQPLTRETLQTAIQQLCPNPQTAILYWHLSPAQINTFLLRPHQDPQIIATIPTDPPFTPTTKTTENFTEWLKQYKTTYNQTRKEEDSELQWRDELPPLLAPLPNLLNIPTINPHLTDLHTLILIPHRDLHLLPLHALLNPAKVPLKKGDLGGFRITYRPNLTLQPTPPNPHPPNQPPTLIGHPTTSRPLQFVRIETALLHHLHPTAQPLTETAVTPDTFTQALQTPAPFLHFTGHGEHNAENPEQSALNLANDHPFTLKDLDNLPNLNIPLISLAACETGITNQGEFINEFVGFPAIFLKKGSRYVLSTLWTVSEESSMIFIIEFFRHHHQHNDPITALTHAQTQLQTLTWTDLAQWYRDTSDPKLKRTVRDGLKSLASNIENDPEHHPPNQTPYAMPYHWGGFILTHS